MSAEIDREIAEPKTDADDAASDAVTGPDDADLTSGPTPAQLQADDETRAPEQDGGEEPRP